MGGRRPPLLRPEGGGQGLGGEGQEAQEDPQQVTGEQGRLLGRVCPCLRDHEGLGVSSALAALALRMRDTRTLWRWEHGWASRGWPGTDLALAMEVLSAFLLPALWSAARTMSPSHCSALTSRT